MNEFFFNLQRFADKATISNAKLGNDNVSNNQDGSVTFSSLNSTNSAIFTITLSKGTKKSYSMFVKSSNVTVSTDENGTVILSVTQSQAEGGMVDTFKCTTDNSTTTSVKLITGAGTYQPNANQSVTFNDSSTIFKSTAANEILQVSDSSITVNTSNNSTNREFTFGILKYKHSSASKTTNNVTLNVDSSNNYSINLDPSNAKGTISYTPEGSTTAKEIKATTGTITVQADEAGTGYITALNYSSTNPDSFTIGDVTYTMTSNLLKADSGGVTKYYKNSVSASTLVPISDLDFDSALLQTAIVIENRTLEISGTILTSMGGEKSVLVVKEGMDEVYGNLTVTGEDNNHFIIESTSDDDKYAEIKIDSGYTVELSSVLTGVDITVSGTTFSVTETEGDFSLTASSSTFAVDGGATRLNLTSGSLLTSVATQSIKAGSYSVYGYGSTSSANDGITVGLNTSGSVVVGNLDVGESFVVNGTDNYTLLGAGLIKETSGNYRIYRDLATTAGGSSFTLGSGEGEILITPDDQGVLEIGTTNSQNSAIFNRTTNPESLYGALSVTSGGYTLDSVNNASDLTDWAKTISLTSDSQFTINKTLAGQNVTIATSDSKKTTFRVTETDSENYFTVNSGNRINPTITGATKITLLTGSITAQANQTITLGENGKSLVFASGSANALVALNDSNFIVTVPATTGGAVTSKFTLDGNTYEVKSGDGMTFTIDSSGKVILGGLNENDVFTYGSNTYSIKSAGFMTGSSSSYKIWNVDGSHSLTSGSVSADSLDVSGNWLSVVTIDGSVTVPAGTSAGLLIDSNFENTYGELAYGGNIASLTSGTGDSGKLNRISINSGTTQYSLSANGSNFLGVSIAAPYSTLMVGSATNNSYQVTLDGAGGNTGLVGATSASLISGKLTANSSISGGVVVDGATVIAGETVTLMTGTSGASIAGLEKGEKFSVNNDPYVFTGAGLRNQDQLKRGTKPNATVDSNTLALASVTSNDDWVGMLAASVNGSTTINGVEIGDNRSIYDVFVVDVTSGNDSLPSKLYGELKTVAGGYSLSTLTNSDAWEDNYTITVDKTTVTISSGFEGKNIKASQAGAEFTVDSLTGNQFTVTDTTSGNGVTLSGAKAITQTKGLVAVGASGIQSVKVGNYTIANSSGLSLDVNVADSTSPAQISLSSLGDGDSFSISSNDSTVAYSINSLGLMNDKQLFKDSANDSFSSATLADLTTFNNKWIYIASISNENILTVPPTVGATASEWLVLNKDKNIRYGTLTSAGGGYSITKGTNDTAWGDATIQVSGGNTLSLSSDFVGETISVQSSKAVFTVSDEDKPSYSVSDSTGGAVISNAKTINQSAGTIALNSSNQSILAGDYTVSGNDKDVTVVVNGDKVTVGALATDDSFTVNDVTYTLLSNGRLQRSDKFLWSGNTIATTDSGSIDVESLGVASNWNGAVEADSNANFTLDSVVSNTFTTGSITSAYVINESDPTTIYGTLTKNDSSYTFSTTGRTSTNDTLRSIEFTSTIPEVSLNSAFANISLSAGDNNFMVTRVSGGYTVNYNGTDLSVDKATVVDLSNGTLIFNGTNSDNARQTITAGTHSISAVSESVDVNYQNSVLTIGGIETANESLKVDANSYMLLATADEGFSIKSDSSATTVEGITQGDKFVIDRETFDYTGAGLAKTKAGSDQLAYLLKDIQPDNERLTLSNLQSISEDIWLGIWSVEGGEVIISNDIPNSVVLVNDLENPTTNYGQLARDSVSGAYNFRKYAGDDAALETIADTFTEPDSITVEQGVTATIDSAFSAKPVKANDATAITVTNSSGTNYIVGGTVDKFVPASMTFTPITGNVFTVNDSTYEKFDAGLTKTAENGTATTKIWSTVVSSNNYVLPDENTGTWSNYIKLTTDDVLDLNKVTLAAGNNIVVNDAITQRWATLDYTPATDSATASYVLNSIDNHAPSIIFVNDDTDPTFTINFDTTVTTGKGTYTINQQTYTGDALKVDATSITSTLQEGTVTLAKDAPAVTAMQDKAISTTDGDSITATATGGKWQTLSGLTDGDTFKIGSTTYKVFGDNTIVTLDSSGNPEKIYLSTITSGTITYEAITEGEYLPVVKLNESNQLDLTKNLGITTAIVVGQNEGEIDPANRIAQLTYDSENNNYTLGTTEDGNTSALQAVLLGTAVNTFNTALTTTVITSGIDTFKVNGNDFAAQNALTIETENNSAFLTNGKVTITDASVTTRYNDGSNNDVTITAKTGTLAVVAENAKTVTINGLDAGDVFNVGSNSYTMTSVGLVTSDDKKLNYNALKNNGITTAEFDLTDDAWKNLVPTDNGVLTINNAVASNVFVADVDIENPSTATKYGTINKTDGTYVLTQDDDNDIGLDGIILTNAKATLPTTCTDTSITAKGATFKVTASKAFTIDAAATTLAMSEEVTEVELIEGTLQATNNIPITVSGNKITTTSGAMTVGIDSTGVFVGDLNEDETFTVGGTAYKMTSVGLLDTTADNQKLYSTTDNKYYLGTTPERIIEAPNGALDLSNQTQKAEVYDSVTAPTTHMASLTVSGGKLTLNEVEGGIKTITLAEDATLTLDFVATITGSGTTTVNGKTYDGTTGNLVINSVIGDTAENKSSTLYSGTITLDSTNSATKTAQATKDSTALTVSTGAITATATDGYFTNLAALNSGDEFTFNGKTYTQTAIGLLIAADNKLNANVTTEVAVANLSGTSWQTIHQATGGALTINTSTGSDVLVVDITTDKGQCKRFGTLTKSGSMYTLTQATNDSQLASITLTGVKATLPKECANVSISAKDVGFSVTASKAFTIDAASSNLGISNVDAIELTSGTLQATNTIPITADGRTITATSGAMTVGIDSGGVFVGGLNEDETFTVDGTAYKRTSVGLLDTTADNQKLYTEVAEKYYLDAINLERIIAADGSALDLSNQTTGAQVYDSVENPTVHMATLKVSGGKLTLNEVDGGIKTITIAQDANLTVDFAATVNSSGTTTVNGQSYTGTTDLVINSVIAETDEEKDSSTLFSGTVTLDNKDSVQASKDTTALSVTSGPISATAVDGYFTNLAALDSGDEFTFNGKTYTQTAIGLLSDNKLNANVADTANISDLSGTAWQTIHQATGGALTINTSTGSDVLVVDITTDKKQCKRYGTLTKSGNTYTLTQATNDSQLASITLTGVKATLPKECANVSISAKDVGFSVTASKAFSIDAASDILGISDVDAIELTSGTIQATNNIPITVDGKTVTATSGAMTVGIDSGGVFVGGLNEDETFTVDGTAYKMTSVGLLDTTDKAQKICTGITDNKYYLGTEFERIIEADGNTLDLSNETTGAQVYDSIIAPTIHMATLAVSGGKLTLTEVSGGINTITLAKDATLTVNFAATVNSSGTTTVNKNTYAGTTDLVINATEDSSTLYSGTITLNSNNPTAQATKDTSALTVSSGSITATAADGYFTTLTALDNGDEFTFDDKTYTQTNLGLISSDDKLNADVTTTVNMTDLSGTNWQNIHKAANGALAIDTNTNSNVLIVDVTNDKGQCKRYGTLTKSGNTYTLTQDAEKDSQLVSIALTDVKAKLPKECANVSISAKGVDFSVTASKEFTIDAASATLGISDVDAIELTNGELQATNNIPITADGKTITTTAGSMTVGIDETGVYVGDLNEDETFNVGTTAYKMTSVGLLDTTSAAPKICADITDNKYYLGTEFERIIEADGSTLDLSNETTSAQVYDSITSPTTHMATLAGSGGKLTLTAVNGGINTINLAKDANLTVKFAATVNSSGTTTVNKKTYAGTTDLIITATKSSSTLYNGTITLDSSNPKAQATKDTSALTVSTGSIIATAADGYFTTLATLDNGDEFTFDDKTYTQTNLGLISSDDRLNVNVTTEVAVSDLSGTAWQSILKANNGTLSIDASTSSGVLVVDVANDKGQCKRYGTLTKSGITYILTQEADKDSQPASITITDVKAKLPKECANVSISAKGVDFSVTASKEFTIDAAASILGISDVDAIELTNGELQANNNIPITADGKTITTTAGSMTVGIDETGVFVGNLNADETFTVDGTAYKMTSVGLLDTTSTAPKICAGITDNKYYLGTEFERIIKADGTTLDLSNETTSAQVYDSLTAPTVHIASLTVSGNKLTLNKADGDITTIKLAKDTDLTVDFEATINSSGTTTVNSQTYAGTTALVINSTKDSSTLLSGTITLDSSNPQAQATKDSTPLTVETGTITAKATDGKFTTIAKIDNGDEFTFNNNTYKQSAVGLINDSTISEELAGKSLTLSKLATAKWSNFLAPSGGVLNLTEAMDNALILDNASAPTTKLADLTISNGRINLKGGTGATAIEAVTLPKDSNLVTDFVTQVYAPSGSVTVNSQYYNATSELIVDADEETSTLYEGTVILDTTNPTITTTNNSSTLNVERGSITATVFDGDFVSIGDLDAQESFTFNGNTYTQTEVGLRSEDGKISENLNGTSIDLADLSTTTWIDILVPDRGTLDLTGTTSNAIVCDDATNPTEKYATLTVANGKMTLLDNGNAADSITTVNVASGTDLTIDFAAQINAPAGTVTVNSKSYDGSTALVLDSDGKTSTLTNGTVSLAKGDSVTMTLGNKITASDGDGMIVSVDGDTITVDGLNQGDEFKVDDDTYKITQSGLINTNGRFWTGKANYADGLTLDALELASNWSRIVVAKDGALSVDDSTLDAEENSTIVDDAYNPTKIYGTLTRDVAGTYTLTKDDENTLSSINVDNAELAIDNNLAEVPITIKNDDGTNTLMTVTPSRRTTNFTVDATGDNPTVADVNAIEITTGKIELSDGQTITLTEGASEVAVIAGNGTYNVGDETFNIAGLADDKQVTFSFDTAGNANTVRGFEKDSTVVIDDVTYTAPEDNAVLHYTEEDNWYFDGFAYDEYLVTVDTNGNVLVAPGVKFTSVISSGRTIGEGTLDLAADIDKTPVTVVNEGNTALNINDANGNNLAENLTKNKQATFNADGVEADSLDDVAGALFKLQDGKSLTAGNTKVTADENDSEVGIGEQADSISMDKSAQIDGPKDIALTLNAGRYRVNGVNFTASGTTSATTTKDGVKVDVAQSDALIYDGMTISTAGLAKIDNVRNVTVTGGAVVENATNRALNVKGTAYLDDKTINTASTTEVTTTSSGVRVGNTRMTVTGDTDGYTVNIAKQDIVGLENVGNGEGVTVEGLKNATVQTDKAGSFTANDKTFIYNNDVVTYGIESGEIVSISDAETVIGDFSDKVTVNGNAIQLTGSDSDITLTADNSGVTKLEISNAGTFDVNGKTYEIQNDGSFAFGMSGGKVSGIESVESGGLIISQDESNFKVNDAPITLASNRSPVTLGIVDSQIVSVSGVDGTINGLNNATVYDLANATINNKRLNVRNSDLYTAYVTDGEVASLSGITSGATISSAPNVIVTTANNGVFTFVNKSYTINDTLDASVDFTTDENSHVTAIDNFAGSISGGLDGITSLNGKDFSVKGAGEVEVTSDGDDITGIKGITDGTEINGDVADLHYVLPEGTVTVNGITYTLEGDENGALFVSNDGRALTGLDKDATLSVSEAGNYTINGEEFTVDAGDAFTVNRDSTYVIDPKNPPITEKTQAMDILSRGNMPVYVEPNTMGDQAVDLTGEEDLALIDSPNANVTVTAGAGSDSVVVRHEANVEVDLNDKGETLIIPTAGNVSLENYNGDNAKVQTFDYSDIPNAIKTNDIKFGDGVMTLGDAIVTYEPDALNTGSMSGTLVNAHGKEQAVAFTYTAGGTIDKSDSNENYLMKGNYAENSDDSQKSGGSSIVGGAGNDTILAGAGDYVNGGGGYNQIYLTDKNMRNSVPEGATIVMNDNSHDTISNFAGGYDSDDDKILIKNMSELVFGYGTGDLVMSSDKGRITFENLAGDNNSAYELKITDGNKDYNAAVAKADSVLAVDDNTADVFYGNEQGISFIEYTGAVEVNLNETSGNLSGKSVQIYGVDKATGGAGDSSLIGAANTPNTLTAGTGNSSIWSNSGKDLMVGNTDANKSGSTSFFYMPSDGRDTITNFDFMGSATDINADKIQLDDASGVTNVFLSGDDVVIGINNSADDYLTLADAKGKSFHFNDDLIAKVDTNVEFDGFSNCYVGVGANATMTVGENMGEVGVWLSDDSLDYHGIWYDGDFAVIDASLANGMNTLAGNERDNLIIGGTGENSIWGGYAQSNDTLVGGTGQNTFFFAVENGHDVIQGAHDGDLISLEDIYLDNIASANISSEGAVIELTDGSRLEVQSNAAIDYRLQDGTTYTADHSSGQWVQK